MNHAIKLILFLSLLGLLVVNGCRVGPDYVSPDDALPVGFDTGPLLLPTTIPTRPPTTASATTHPTTPSTRATARVVEAAARKPAAPVDLNRWWASFDDPKLDALVEQAVDANLDLAIAAQRLQQAREAYFLAGGSALPLVDITAGAARGSGSNSTRGRVGPPINAATNTKNYREITHVAGFDAAWELDLFGQISRAVEAASADVQVAEEDRRQVLVSVIAETVRTYADLRSLQVRLRIARDNVAAQQRTVDLVAVRLNRGLGNELDVVLAERQLSTALARVAPLEASIREAERRVAVLLARPPHDLYAELDAPGQIPGLGAETDIGVPLDLVRRRPDIRRSERQIAAANARIGVATAQLFPQVSISAALGFQGQGLGVTPAMNNLIWSVGPSVRWPLLDFGRVDAQIQQQTFRTRELLLSYRKTVLLALEEVENAVGSYAAQRNRLEQLTVAVASSQQAVNLATQRFDLGLTDFLNVLDAQRQLYDLQDQLAVSQQSATTQLIALYKSLGGGWEQFREPASPAGPQPAVVALGREIMRGRK